MTKPWALITGASVGIGREFALQLAASGHNLVLVSRSQSDLEAVAAETAKFGAQSEILVADLVQPAERAKVASRLRSLDQPIEVLINNAGIGVNQRFVSGELERELYMLELLVTAVLELSHAAAGQMQQRNTGKIVIVSSVASFIAGGTYSAAKAWTTVFAEGLQVELAPHNVKVMALCPGFTHTEFHQRAGIRKADVPASLWLDVRDLVRTALVDLERGVVISVPDWKYKILVALAKSLPRKTVRNFGFKFRNKSRR